MRKSKTIKIDIDLDDEPYYISKRIRKDSPLGKKTFVSNKWDSKMKHEPLSELDHPFDEVFESVQALQALTPDAKVYFKFTCAELPQ